MAQDQQIVTIDRTLDGLQRQIGDWATRKGWALAPENIPEKLMLVVSELSEALEEYRSGDPARMGVWYTNPDGSLNHGATGKPEGFGIELADAVIRVLHLCAALNIPLHDLIQQKMAYNEGRPYRHGNKLA